MDALETAGLWRGEQYLRSLQPRGVERYSEHSCLSGCFVLGLNALIRMLEMQEKQRREESNDLIQVPLFDSALTGGLSLDQLQPQESGGKAGIGFLKEKARGLGDNRGGVSLLLFLVGFRM